MKSIRIRTGRHRKQRISSIDHRYLQRNAKSTKNKIIASCLMMFELLFFYFTKALTILIETNDSIVSFGFYIVLGDNIVHLKSQHTLESIILS